MPDLNAMKSFLIVADTLNFSRAAELRNTVQSAISLHIKKLEDELDCKLFERGRGQSMQLTSEGRAFIAYAQRIMDLNSEAVETIRQTKAVRRIKLGTTVTLAMSVVVDALRAFTDKNESVQIQIDCDRSDALLAKLDAGEIDAAFMIDQGKRTGRDFVENMPLVWVCADGFELNRHQDVPLAFLMDGRDLRRFAFEALDRFQRTGYLAHLSSHPIGVRSFVLAGLALTVMPKVSVSEPLKIAADIDGLPPLGSLALSFYRKPGFNSDIDVLSSILHNLTTQSHKNKRSQ